MADFDAALDEVQPAFGANTESLQKHVMQVCCAECCWSDGVVLHVTWLTVAL